MSHGVIHAVARDMYLTPGDIIGPSRSPYISTARKVCVVIFRDRYGMTFPQIARAIKRSDSTTAYYHYCTGQKLIHDSPALAQLVAKHMSEPKLAPLVVEPFEPMLLVRLDNRFRLPSTVNRIRSKAAERVWRARCAA